MACEKDLDLFPKDRISDGTFWKTVDQIKMAATNFYDFLPGHGMGDLSGGVFSCARI